MHPAMIKKFVRLDEETGKTYWLPRVADDFECDSVTPESAANTFNTRFAGKECFDWYDERRGDYVGLMFGKSLRRAVVVWVLTHGEFPSHRLGFHNGDRRDTRPTNLFVKQRTRS